MMGVPWVGSIIPFIIDQSHGVWPEVGSHGKGPYVVCVRKLGTNHVLQEAYGPLCHTILMVRTDTGKCQPLVVQATILNPCICLEDAIVSMVMLNGYTTSLRMGLKGSFALQRVRCR